MLIDLLVYSETSEGQPVDAEAVMEAAKEAGLDGLVVAGQSGPAQDFDNFRAVGEDQGLTIFPGRVVQTDHGLVLALMPSGVELAEVTEAAEAIKAVDAAGGASVALRPYDRDVSRPMGDQLFTLTGLHACEVCNGRVAEIANDLALEAASNLELPCVGTSSATEAEDLGSAATIFRRPVESIEALIEQVKEGACWPVSIGDEVPKDYSADRGGGQRRRPRGERGENSGEPKPSRRSGRNDRSGGGKRRRRSDEGASRRVTEAPEHADGLPDDIGNRLQPGEASPFHDATRKE